MPKVSITDEEYRLCRYYARNACIGGKSQFRTDDRMENLFEDQLIGQLGNCALSKWISGSVELYVEARERCDANPHQGDDGSDIPFSNIDIKTSMMRKDQDHTRYNLLVAPAELHEENWIYILGLVPKFDVETGVVDEVWLIGWKTGQEMKRRGKRNSGIFEGYYVCPSTNLHLLPPFIWR